MTFKHTPGPWRITRDHQSPASIEAARGDGGALAKVYLTDPKTRRRTPEYEANARLMADAPETLDTLAALADWAAGLATLEPGLPPETWAALAPIWKRASELIERAR